MRTTKSMVNKAAIILTDIHLDFILDYISSYSIGYMVREGALDQLNVYSMIGRPVESKIMFLLGDIATYDTLKEGFDFLVKYCDYFKIRKIYFVLGNHDYYGSSIAKTKELANEIHNDKDKYKKVIWASNNDDTYLGGGVHVVGCDSFADAGYGNYDESNVVINDSRKIKEFIEAASSGKSVLKDTMKLFAELNANKLESNLNKVLESGKKVSKIIVLSHVPPFKEVCKYNGKPTDEDYLPFFASKVTGDVLLKFARNNKDIDILVLSGHTHDHGEALMLPNLRSIVSLARYNHPRISGHIKIY